MPTPPLLEAKAIAFGLFKGDLTITVISDSIKGLPYIVE